jgi:hypothetical protein
VFCSFLLDPVLRITSSLYKDEPLPVFTVFTALQEWITAHPLVSSRPPSVEPSPEAPSTSLLCLPFSWTANTLSTRRSWSVPAQNDSSLEPPSPRDFETKRHRVNFGGARTVGHLETRVRSCIPSLPSPSSLTTFSVQISRRLPCRRY